MLRRAARGQGQPVVTFWYLSDVAGILSQSRDHGGFLTDNPDLIVSSSFLLDKASVRKSDDVGQKRNSE